MGINSDVCKCITEKNLCDFNNLLSDINMKSYKREYIIYYSMSLCIFSGEQVGETINFKQLLLLLNKNIINDDFFCVLFFICAKF